MSEPWFIDRLSGDGPALIRDGVVESRPALRSAIARWHAELDRLDVPPGAGVSIVGDFSLEACALLLATMTSKRVAVPLTEEQLREHPERLDVAGPALVAHVPDRGAPTLTRRAARAPHPLLDALRERGGAGLILFSSGSSGRSKAALLDADRLLAPRRAGRPLRTATFLMFDHIGGLNTLFRALADGGVLIALRDRNPEHVAAAIADAGIELLPTTPTFLKMLLISGALDRHDVRSLRLITYGTEPMPATTLRHLHQALPDVRLKQTYGMSELGILPTRSRSSDSLWVEVAGGETEVRVVDGTLHVRTPTALLGYLDAPSPLDAEGWLDTGDLVETDGPYFRFLGRRTEVINVGGEKVHPSEVENVLLGLDNIADALVSARPNAVTGQVVVARVSLQRPEDPRDLARRVRRSCREVLAAFKVPALVEIADEPLHGDRFKKRRAAS